MGKGLTIRCPAKVNLHLRVLRRRQDGYHDIITLMQPIGLYDTIEVSLRGKGVTVRCNRPDVPQDEGNLAHRAAMVFQAQTQKNFGLHVDIQKEIPVGAGLGGGSSDAAGVLMAISKLLEMDVPRPKLLQWASKIGSDVPFFILGRPAWATGRGERLKEAEIQVRVWYVVAFPGFSVSTKWVYDNTDLGLTKKWKDFKIQYLIPQMEDILYLLHNDLESVTARAYPWITEQKDKMRLLGARGVLMSGSGPAVFGIFDEFEAALRAWEMLGGHGKKGIWLAEGLRSFEVDC